MKLCRGLPSLRRKRALNVLTAAFSAVRRRESFRLVHYSIQSNHLHLLCEADDRRELTRGIQALAIRIAKGLNSLWGRAGKLFADRYHDHILRTPREVMRALRYVLNNAAKHGARWAAREPDPFSSARWFQAVEHGLRRLDSGPPCLARARTWLLSVGWRRAGAVEITTARPAVSRQRFVAPT